MLVRARREHKEALLLVRKASSATLLQLSEACPIAESVFGSPAVIASISSRRPVALRPHLSMGLPFSNPYPFWLVPGLLLRGRSLLQEPQDILLLESAIPPAAYSVSSQLAGVAPAPHRVGMDVEEVSRLLNRQHPLRKWLLSGPILFSSVFLFHQHFTTLLQNKLYSTLSLVNLSVNST